MTTDEQTRTPSTPAQQRHHAAATTYDVAGGVRWQIDPGYRADAKGALGTRLRTLDPVVDRDILLEFTWTAVLLTTRFLAQPYLSPDVAPRLRDLIEGTRDAAIALYDDIERLDVLLVPTSRVAFTVQRMCNQAAQAWWEEACS